MLEASHFDAGTAYAAVNRNSLDDLHPHIFRTQDFGQTWQETVTGIRDIDFVRVVREDPVRKSLLYAGTEEGAYVSFDDGDHWQSLRLNMPLVAIHDLALEQDDLVAATYGRSFWILDDVTPLRELDNHFSASQPRLFAPRPAIRVRHPALLFARGRAKRDPAPDLRFHRNTGAQLFQRPYSARKGKG